LPVGAELLQAKGKRGTGNILLLFRDPPPGLVLKLYRFRRSRFRETCKDFSQQRLEGKRGAHATARYETERQSLAVWMREGFGVVPPVDQPLPEGVEPPAMWLEYCPGRTLDRVISDPAVGEADKQSVLGRLAASMTPRHARALELREPLLVQEHAALTHVFVHADQLLVFDLETGYRPGFPVLEALAQEVAGYARSVLKFGGTDGPALLEAFVSGYGDPGLLRRITDHALFTRSLVRRLKRWDDQRRRPLSKTAAMKQVHAHLERG
jgi:hypothetical protein